MDGTVTKEEAATRWRRDLEEAEADSRRSWPIDVTARMSEFERLTLITEILMPVRNELALGFEDTRQREQDQEEENRELGVNRVYSVILAAAAAGNRWLKEDLGPALRTEGRYFETAMTLDPATDVDRWTGERAGPLTEEPAGGDDIEGWLHWADIRTAGTLPEETAPRAEWSEAVGHSMALVREAIHRLTLARLHLRTGDPVLMETNVTAQTTENVYCVVAWLASTLQAWGIALVRLHNAVPESHDGP